MMLTDAATEAKFAKSYEVTKSLAESFKGMMSSPSIALFEAFLGLQGYAGICGNCIEFGVYRGRSASVILKHLRPDERMGLIDVKEEYPEFDKLRAVNPMFEFFKGKSEVLADDAGLRGFLSDGVRFSHHDASHSFVNVSAEMKLMEPHIGPRGLMVLDDFGNPSYMQVVAACFAHLSRSGCGMELLLYSNNKAYLCRRDDFEFYARFVLDDLPPLLRAAGLNMYLTRTDNDAGYRGFSIAPKIRPTAPDRYGLHIFGDRFYKI